MRAVRLPSTLMRVAAAVALMSACEGSELISRRIAFSSQTTQPNILVMIAGAFASAGETKRPALDDDDLGKQDLALGGYDPVAYVPSNGGKGTKGSKKITATHRGMVRSGNLRRQGRGKTGANPKSFTIENDQLYVFSDGL